MPAQTGFLSALQIPLTQSSRSPSWWSACTSTPSKEISQPPTSTKTKGTLPPSLHSTTLLHNIPTTPSHLPPSKHPLDNDAKILALSFQPTGQVWPRFRFVRSKPFMTESRLQKRIYCGEHGTPGMTGPSAPLKPKPSPLGAFIWGRGKRRRIFTFGPRALPLALDIATLVARGPSAMGTVLTDAPELSPGRATELAAMPVAVDDVLVVLGVSRNGVGRIGGAFVVEIDRGYEVRKRLPRVDVPRGCFVRDFVVGERFCVALLLREGEMGGAGMFGTLFGRMQEGGVSPGVDCGYGSVLMVVPRDGSAASCCRVPGEVFMSFADVGDAEDGLLRVEMLAVCRRDGVALSDDVVRKSTLTDVQTARYWAGGAGGEEIVARERRLVLDVSSGVKGIAKTVRVEALDEELCDENVSVLCAAWPRVSRRTGGQRCVYTIFDHATGKTGLLAVERGERVGAVRGKWMAEEAGCLLSGLVLSEDGRYVSVLQTREDGGAAARVCVFDVRDVEQGPVYETVLDRADFGEVGFSVGGFWMAEEVDWQEMGGKVVKSGYEIFDEREWNDIESGFSSLGLGQ